MRVDELRHELGRLADEIHVTPKPALAFVIEERRRRQRRARRYATVCGLVVVIAAGAVALVGRGGSDRVVTRLAIDPAPSTTGTAQATTTSLSAQPTSVTGPSPTITTPGTILMPAFIGESFSALGDSGQLTAFAFMGPLVFHWVANDTAPSGVVFAQTPGPGQPVTGTMEFWVSVGGPIVSLDSMSAADRDVARRVGIVDDREPIQKIETSAGPAYKVDAFLFAADCKAVAQAYRTSIDPSYQDVCSSEPGRMLGR